MSKPEVEEISVVFNEDDNQVTIIKYEFFGFIRLTEDEFDELAYKIRQTPFGRTFVKKPD